MEIDVRARRVVESEDLHKQIERSIEYAIDRHRSRIDRISVYLADLNGPRGGIDKLCQITADVRGTRPVQILESGDDLMTTVNRAARRLGYCYRAGTQMRLGLERGANKRIRTTSRQIARTALFFRGVSGLASLA